MLFFSCVGFLLLMLLHPSSGDFWLLSPSHKKQPVRAQQHLFFCTFINKCELFLMKSLVVSNIIIIIPLNVYHRGTQENYFGFFEHLSWEIPYLLCIVSCFFPREEILFPGLHFFAVSQVQCLCTEWVHMSLHPYRHGLVLELALSGYKLGL